MTYGTGLLIALYEHMKTVGRINTEKNTTVGWESIWSNSISNDTRCCDVRHVTAHWHTISFLRTSDKVSEYDV